MSSSSLNIKYGKFIVTVNRENVRWYLYDAEIRSGLKKITWTKDYNQAVIFMSEVDATNVLKRYLKGYNVSIARLLNRFKGANNENN